MVRSVVASGTQLCVLTTEHILRDETGNEGEVFAAGIDLGLGVALDVFEIRVYEMLLAAGTLRRTYYAKFTGPTDDEPNMKSSIINIPPMTVRKEWKLTIKQTLGTGRNVAWTIYK